MRIKPSKQGKRTPPNKHRIGNYSTPVRDSDFDPNTYPVRDSDFDPNTYPVPSTDKPKKDK